MTGLMTQADSTAADASNVPPAERLSSEELRTMDAYWRACTYLLQSAEQQSAREGRFLRPDRRRGASADRHGLSAVVDQRRTLS